MKIACLPVFAIIFLKSVCWFRMLQLLNRSTALSKHVLIKSELFFCFCGNHLYGIQTVQKGLLSAVVGLVRSAWCWGGGGRIGQVDGTVLHSFAPANDQLLLR